MPTTLKDLSLTSVDLVDAGANPDSKIQLFKRKGDENSPESFLQKAITALTGVFGKSSAAPPHIETVEKEARTFADEMERDRLREISNEMWSACYMLSDSLTSILHDGDLSEDDRRGMMFESLDQFSEMLRGAIPAWALGNRSDEGEPVVKGAAFEAAFAELIAKYVTPGESGERANTAKRSERSDEAARPARSAERAASQEAVKIEKSHKEEIDTMSIDKNKLTPEELAALEAIEKKYGTAEPGETTPVEGGDVNKGAETTPPATQTAQPTAAAAIPDLHPEVKKALDDNKALTAKVEELQKSLEIERLATVAKKYEIIGKKADELAPKLYELKKAGGAVYDEFVALFDEQVTLVEKSRLFDEIGTARGGGISGDSELAAKAAEIRKNNSGMSEAAALAKAFEENPELAAKYEKEYANRRAE